MHSGARCLREALGQRVLFLDGALGTEFYSRGVYINKSYDALNVSTPELVRTVHRDYVRAGCDLITTNTFGANRIRLQAFGLEEQATEIVRRGVQLAREVAGDKAWVLGSVGPTGARLAPVGRLSPGQAYAAFRKQIAILAEEGVDGLLLETFSSLEELWQAVRAARDVARDVPLITAASFVYTADGDLVEGPEPQVAARTMCSWGADAIGVNCSNGPKVVLEVLERMAAVSDKPLLASPNAGQPQAVDGRQVYMAGPEYMAEYARRFALKGATLIGGCCGTTPAMIREMRSYVRSVAPGMTERPAAVVTTAEEGPTQTLERVPIVERSEFARKLYSGDFCISVELDPPRGIDTTRSIN